MDGKKENTYPINNFDGMGGVRKNERKGGTHIYEW